MIHAFLLIFNFSYSRRRGVSTIFKQISASVHDCWKPIRFVPDFVIYVVLVYEASQGCRFRERDTSEMYVKNVKGQDTRKREILTKLCLLCMTQLCIVFSPVQPIWRSFVFSTG